MIVRNVHFSPAVEQSLACETELISYLRDRENRLACIAFFSQGNMKRHPLFQGSMFSSWRLHARSNSETSLQVLLPLDLWHVCHNLDVIKTHWLDTTEIIHHINLVALTSHIKSRSSRHIQLNYFGVSSLPMPCATFLSLFGFSLVWVSYFLDLFECLLSFTCVLACPRSVSIFVAISMLSHAWNCFAWTFTQMANDLTHMRVDMFAQYSIHVFHSMFINSVITYCRHSFHRLTCFQFFISESSQPRLSLCLHQGYIAQSGEGRLTFLSGFLHSRPKLASWTRLRISRGQWLLGPKNCANLPWANSLSQLESRIAQSQQPTFELDCTCCSSSSQLVSQHLGLCLE